MLPVINIETVYRIIMYLQLCLLLQSQYKYYFMSTRAGLACSARGLAQLTIEWAWYLVVPFFTPLFGGILGGSQVVVL